MQVKRVSPVLTGLPVLTVRPGETAPMVETVLTEWTVRPARTDDRDSMGRPVSPATRARVDREAGPDRP